MIVLGSWEPRQPLPSLQPRRFGEAPTMGSQALGLQVGH
jgi:hypothetical protein